LTTDGIKWGETAATIIVKQVNNHKLVSEITYLDTNPLLAETLTKNQIDNSSTQIADLQSRLRFYQSKKYTDKVATVMGQLALAYEKIDDNINAIAHWEQSLLYYRQGQNWQQIGTILLLEAHIYNKLGNVDRAIALAENALQISNNYKYQNLRAVALLTRALAYRLIGKYNQAIIDAYQSLQIAQTIDKQYQAAAFNSLGTAYMEMAQLNYQRSQFAKISGDLIDADTWKKKAIQSDLQALDNFRQSLDISRQIQDKVSEIWILINSIKIEPRIQKNYLFAAKFKLAQILLSRLPNSSTKVYTAIELAKLSLSSSTDLLNQALKIARQLQDLRATSFALGNLAHLYELSGDYPLAFKFTQQAQIASVQIPESLYLWQWQAARILAEQTQILPAIASYEQAVTTLKNISTHSWKLTYTQDIEAIYRQLIGVQLNLVENQNQAALNTVINTIETWQKTELEYYFGKEYPTQKNAILINTNQTTAFLFSIILPDKTAIILSLPNGSKKLHWIELNSQSLQQEMNQFRIGLEKRSDIIYRTGQAQHLYNQIIRPFQADLESFPITTLVFIPDGIFRTTPITALYDGKQFLFQKYAIAITPSLSLTSPYSPQRKHLQALAMGLSTRATVNGQRYIPLVNVKQEINQILRIIPGSKQLLNNNFTRDRIITELAKSAYSIIHIATHGEFGIVPEDNFLITGNNQKLTITDIEQIIHTTKGKIELLSLTACETALGNEISALGMAGVAVQSGVSSVIASLWSINDSATATLMTQFYQQWQHNQLSKAEALQKAQQNLFSSHKKYTHPYYWAPFVLVGNWL
jgi:CHAT domain-containing protein